MCVVVGGTMKSGVCGVVVESVKCGVWWLRCVTHHNHHTSHFTNSTTTTHNRLHSAAHHHTIYCVCIEKSSDVSSGIMEDLPRMMTAGAAALPMTANGLLSPSVDALDEEEPRLGGGIFGC